VCKSDVNVKLKRSHAESLLLVKKACAYDLNNTENLKLHQNLQAITGALHGRQQQSDLEHQLGQIMQTVPGAYQHAN